MAEISSAIEQELKRLIPNNGYGVCKHCGSARQICLNIPLTNQPKCKNCGSGVIKIKPKPTVSKSTGTSWTGPR